MPNPKQPLADPKAPPKSEGRKPWRKRTPVEVVLDQADKLKVEIAETEELLKAKRKQLQQFEEVRKIFEAGGKL